MPPCHLFLVALLLTLDCAVAEDATAPDRGASPPAPEAQPDRGQIAWIPSWEAGLAEAQRLERPILLISAAPHCHNISGLW